MDFNEHLLAHYPHSFVHELNASLGLPSQNACLLNPFVITDEHFQKMFSPLLPHPIVEHAYLYDKNTLTLGKQILHDAGGYYLQEPSAMCVAAFLPVEEGDYILDLCAAPGGKTIQLGFRYPHNPILSNDISYARASVLANQIERFGLANVVVSSLDPHAFSSAYSHYFDQVLVDAPCSGSGMFRKEPKMRADWTYAKVLACQRTQLQLLDQASTLVASGGYLLYSTCSFSYEEDEAVVLAFLKTHPEFTLDPLPHREGFYEHPDAPGTVHLFPHLFPGEGHFIARFKASGMKVPHHQSKEKSSLMGANVLHDYPHHFSSLITREDRLYGLTASFTYLPSRHVVRPGLEIGSLRKGIFTPAHAFSRYLRWDRDLALTNEEATRYLHGETLTFAENLRGFYTVSYLGAPLGWVKLVDGVAKNHYPKGLRI